MGRALLPTLACLALVVAGCTSPSGTTPPSPSPSPSPSPPAPSPPAATPSPGPAPPAPSPPTGGQAGCEGGTHRDTSAAGAAFEPALTGSATPSTSTQSYCIEVREGRVNMKHEDSWARATADSRTLSMSLWEPSGRIVTDGASLGWNLQGRPAGMYRLDVLSNSSPADTWTAQLRVT